MTVLISGNEGVAQGARDCGVVLGTGYPGTPSTEILEYFHSLGGRAQWAPNEKVALEVGIGAAFAGVRALVTMKHVGLNVAADPLFTAAYSGVKGGLVIVVCDDPGMGSSQNEQDSRYYARAAKLPMLEPSDSQEAYDYTREAFDLSEQFHLPVLLRLTTRVCHSKSLTAARERSLPSSPQQFTPDIRQQVMIPAHARPAHRRLEEKLEGLRRWSEQSALNTSECLPAAVGIVTSGAAYQHVKEAAPQAAVFKTGITHPLPFDALRRFADSVSRLVVVEEGEPIIAGELRAAGFTVEDKPAAFGLGELNVARVRTLLNILESGPADKPHHEAAGPAGKPPELCPTCPHRKTFEVLSEIECIVAGDIGCYTLAALPPLEALHIQLCMGSSIGIGLGLRHALGEAAAGSRIVSVIGDSTFFHSGITGLVEMVYNRPPGGHVVLVLDNSTTAMTGLQDHPGTGRRLDVQTSPRIAIEDIARACGVEQVFVIDPVAARSELQRTVQKCLTEDKTSVIVVRRACTLALKQRKKEVQNVCGG